MIDAEQRRAADGWFLERGLPAVLRPGRLVRRLWPRSAPALATLAVLMANSILVVSITGQHAIDIEGQPTRAEWFVLVLLVLVLPVAVDHRMAGVAHRVAARSHGGGRALGGRVA